MRRRRALAILAAAPLGAAGCSAATLRELGLAREAETLCLPLAAVRDLELALYHGALDRLDWIHGKGCTGRPGAACKFASADCAAIAAERETVQAIHAKAGRVLHVPHSEIDVRAVVALLTQLLAAGAGAAR
jgi:hypothetical protein